MGRQWIESLKGKRPPPKYGSVIIVGFVPKAHPLHSMGKRCVNSGLWKLGCVFECRPTGDGQAGHQDVQGDSVQPGTVRPGGVGGGGGGDEPAHHLHIPHCLNRHSTQATITLQHIFNNTYSTQSITHHVKKTRKTSIGQNIA